MRPIDADALMVRLETHHDIANANKAAAKCKENRFFWNGVALGVGFAIREFSTAPTLDPAQLVPHGRWETLNHEKDYWGFDSDGDFGCFSDYPVICSVCHYDLTERQIPQTPHCPNCGARMRKEAAQ